MFDYFCNWRKKRNSSKRMVGRDVVYWMDKKMK